MSAAGMQRWRALAVGLAITMAILVTAPVASAVVDQAAAVNVAATAGTQLSGPVATFSSLTANPTAFTATVDWGDGSPTEFGTVVATGFDNVIDETTYAVESVHTYASAGVFPTTVVITEADLQPVVVNGTATVAAAPEPGQPVPPPPPPPPPEAPPLPPSILSAGFSPAPRAGHPTVLRIRASSPNAPVVGYAVNLGEGGGRFGALACSLLPPLAGDPLNPFLPATLTTFGLGYTFHNAGTHTISLVVGAGGCTGEATTAQRIDVVVGRDGSGAGQAAAAAALRPRDGLLAGAAQATGCSDDLTVPDDVNADVVAAAAVCLVNVERVDAGLAPLAVDATLIASATAHNRTMIEARVFQHQGPSEPDLAARGASVGYRAGMGENIGYGVGALATASAMVDAWMNSPPHRANILDPRFKGIGMSVLAEAPTGATRPGATYTTNFGTEVPSGKPPAAVTPPRPGVTAGLSPSRFRASASGPSASPVGPGALVSYRLTRAANVVFTVRRKLAGRRVGRRCVAPRPSNRRARPCVRTRRVGTFRDQGTIGANRLRFRGRLNGRRLAPGAYQLVVVATDQTGASSTPRTLSFRILRGRA